MKKAALAIILTAPSANNRVYDGTAKQILNGGIDEIGTMIYALCNDRTTVPEEDAYRTAHIVMKFLPAQTYELILFGKRQKVMKHT